MFDKIASAYIKMLDESISLKTHYGTCVDCFNTSGNRKRTKPNLPFFDATDFAGAVTDDVGNNKDEIKITKNEFLTAVKLDQNHQAIADKPNTEFLHIPERDSHIMYDADTDIHHFYERN